jgi:SAM-dependent methyltransferase
MSLAAKLRRLPELGRALLHRGLRGVFGLEVSLPTEDRRLLEQVVLPYFARDAAYARVLFVGCDWYTSHYGKLFAGRAYWTLEKDPGRRKHGGVQHVTDALANLRAHFEASWFDLIVVNGVLGWGLDDRDEAERSLLACAESLREGGVLVLGWNDVAEKRPLAPEDSKSLARLAPWPFPPLGAARHLTATANRHTFSFYVRPPAAS